VAALPEKHRTRTVLPRGVRMEAETIEQLQRVQRGLGKHQAELLRQYINRGYQAALGHPKYGPLLTLVEEMAAEQAKEQKPRSSRGAVIRLNESEATELRRFAYEETGDPGQASTLARE
jgi:hypothetical protein